MQGTEPRSVSTQRVDPRFVARFLPEVLLICPAEAAAAVAEAALVAGIAGVSPDACARSFRQVLEFVLAMVGVDYAEGFADGFTCSWGKRGRGRRYVQGMDDAADARAALRHLNTDWAWTLLQHTQPRTVA